MSKRMTTEEMLLYIIKRRVVKDLVYYFNMAIEDPTVFDDADEEFSTILNYAGDAGLSFNAFRRLVLNSTISVMDSLTGGFCKELYDYIQSMPLEQLKKEFEYSKINKIYRYVSREIYYSKGLDD